MSTIKQELMQQYNFDDEEFDILYGEYGFDADLEIMRKQVLSDNDDDYDDYE